MAIHKPDIKQHIQNTPKPTPSFAGNGNKPDGGDSFVSAVLPFAQQYVEKMPLKHKFVILSVIYLVLAGVWWTLTHIYDLICEFPNFFMWIGVALGTGVSMFLLMSFITFVSEKIKRPVIQSLNNQKIKK